MEGLHPTPPEITTEQELAVAAGKMATDIRGILQTHLDTHSNSVDTVLYAFPEGTPDAKDAAIELLCDKEREVATSPTISDRTAAWERDEKRIGFSYVETNVRFFPVIEFEGVCVRKETTLARKGNDYERTSYRYSLTARTVPKKLSLEKSIPVAQTSSQPV